MSIECKSLNCDSVSSNVVSSNVVACNTVVSYNLQNIGFLVTSLFNSLKKDSLAVSVPDSVPSDMVGRWVNDNQENMGVVPLVVNPDGSLLLNSVSYNVSYTLLNQSNNTWRISSDLLFGSWMSSGDVKKLILYNPMTGDAHNFVKQ